MLDAAAAIEFVSQAGSHPFASRLRDAIGDSFLDVLLSLVSFQEQQPLIQKLSYVSGNVGFTTLAMACCRLSDNCHPLVVHIEPRTDRDGRPLGYMCQIVADAGDFALARGRFHDDAADAERRTKLCVDSRGTIINVDCSQQVLLAWRQDELLGKSMRELILPVLRQNQTTDNSVSTRGDADVSICWYLEEAKGAHSRQSPDASEPARFAKHGGAGFERYEAMAELPSTPVSAFAGHLFATRHLQPLDRLDVAKQLLASITHELNQPLATIGTYVRIAKELLSTATLDAARVGELFEKIDQQNHYAADVINSLRDLIGDPPEDRAPMDINGLIEQTVALVKQDLDYVDVDIECQLAVDLPAVDIIYVQIQQVLLNLIRNSFEALQATTADAQIVIESRCNDAEFVTVLVRDNGDGISHEHAEKIFIPFYTTKKDQGKIGAGLSVCKSIIESHNGILGLNTDYLEGAEFYFMLPIATGFVGDDNV